MERKENTAEDEQEETKADRQHNVHESGNEAGELGDVPIETESEAAFSEQSQTSDSELDGELDQLRRQADEHHQRYLRTQADFDNFRRRARLEKEDFAKYASAKLIEQLLPVVDNLERAIHSSKDNQDYDVFAKGVDMIHRQLEQVLDLEGLKKMDTVGQPFNPEYHQAIMQVESEDHEEGTVVEEVQKGYVLKDKVLRPAMVKVSV